jgi:hypothetical protein
MLNELSLSLGELCTSRISRSDESSPSVPAPFQNPQALRPERFPNHVRTLWFDVRSFPDVIPPLSFLTGSMALPFRSRSVTIRAYESFGNPRSVALVTFDDPSVAVQAVYNYYGAQAIGTNSPNSAEVQYKLACVCFSSSRRL